MNKQSFSTNKITLVLLALMVIATTSFWVFINNNAAKGYKPGIWPEADQSVSQAQLLYKQAKESNINLISGPCLSNSVIAGWVVDIVHSPRQSIDDLPSNQCQSYLEGQAKHFVELDLEGNLIRVQ